MTDTTLTTDAFENWQNAKRFLEEASDNVLIGASIKNADTGACSYALKDALLAAVNAQKDQLIEQAMAFLEEAVHDEAIQNRNAIENILDEMDEKAGEET